MYKLLDFVCTECGHEFEELVKPGEEPECPECQGMAVPQEDFSKRVNRKGAHYKNVSWSIHHAGD